MINMKKSFIGVGVILMVIMVVLLVFSHSNTSSNQSQSNVKWYTNLTAGLQEAKNTNKPVFIDFYAGWCSYCKELDENALSNSNVQEKLIQNYVLVKIDTDQNPDLSSQYKIYNLPTMVILNSNGQEIKRQQGYVTVDQLLSWI